MIMTLETFLGLLGLAHAAAWTPGPNNSLVASSGARFGIRATLPHIAGIGIGFPFMVFVIAMGLGVLFEQSPLLREGVRWTGVIVLLWFAYKIATASTEADTKSESKPFTFIQSAAFQWINPKAWVMAIGITAQFVNPDQPILSALTVAAVFVFVGFSSATGWTVLGKTASLWLTSPIRLRLFNYTMAGLIVASVFAIAFGELV
jgi:threonine/homoserine/homoserine lactone efflux protein